LRPDLDSAPKNLQEMICLTQVEKKSYILLNRVIGLIDRVFLFFYPKYQMKNLKLIAYVLLENDSYEFIYL